MSFLLIAGSRGRLCGRRLEALFPDLRDEEANIRDLIDETPTSGVGYALARADVG